MLIRTATTTVLDSLFSSARMSHQVRSCLFANNRIAYFIAQDADSQIYNQYLQSQEDKIKSYSGGNFKFDRVSLPRHGPNIKEAQQKLQTQWKNKRLAFNIDGSALIGTKRIFMKNHLQKNVFQGLSSPDALFNQINPSIEISIEQLKFDQNTFFCSDPIAKQVADANSELSGQKLDEVLQDALATTYENEPERFKNRLKTVLNVPEPYLKLIEMAVYNQNPIYFFGINEYCFRNLLSKYLTFQEVRQIFMLSLKFAESQSYKYKLGQMGSKSINLEERYQNYCRELIYLNYYSLIKRIENGDILKRVNSLSKFSPHETGRAVRTPIKKNNEVKGQNNIIVIGHQYTISTLGDSIKVKNLQHFTLYAQNQTPIQSKSINTPAALQKQKPLKSTENDAQKIEKHAILEVMLGDLWNQPYTFNKFPYLSENYNKLNEQDKNYVKKLYHDNVVKYTGAKRVFYKTNISKIESLDSDSVQYINMKNDYEEKRKEYQKIQQNLKKKQEQIEKNTQKGSKSDRLKENYDQYKSNYQEDPVKLYNINLQAEQQLKKKLANAQKEALESQSQQQQEQGQKKRKTRPKKKQQENKEQKQEK